MKVHVKNSSSGETYQIDVEATTSLEVLKLKLSSGHNLNYNLIQLSFNNAPLKDNVKTMQALGIVDGSQLQLQILNSTRGRFIQQGFHGFLYCISDFQYFPLSKYTT